MPDITRRSFIAGGAGAVGAVLASRASAGASPAAGARPVRVPTTREDHRLVIVGSGFGGGVAALRFAEAGVPVLVLERGKRWPTGPNADTFPRPPATVDRRLFWMGSAAAPLDPLLRAVGPPAAGLGRLAEALGSPTEGLGPVAALLGRRATGTVSALRPYTGLLERVSGIGMDIICAAGVGGGSLAYQGMTLQPSAELFEAVMPAGLDFDRMRREHYPRVARMLRLATAPDELIAGPTYRAARTFARHVTAAGYPLEKIPMPIDWDFALRELKGEMRPTYTNGDCTTGVNNGGKHTVDVTYLARAEATGRVTVAPLHEVTEVVRAGDGRWEVHVDRIDTDGVVLQRKIITAGALILAAGTANTNRLLLRARDREAVPDLPDGLGEGWGTNGDRICIWSNPGEGFGMPQGGPVVYGSKDWSDPATANTIIQASLPPLPDLRITMIVGYGVSAGRGRFVWDPLRQDAVLHWDPAGDATLTRRIHQRMRRIVGPTSTFVDTTDFAPTTWHPLGGACMGTVCDLDGRARGQRGLYVLDGSLIPGSTAACNPSMTIAAIVERATDSLIRRDVGAHI